MSCNEDKDVCYFSVKIWDFGNTKTLIQCSQTIEYTDDFLRI